MNIYRDIRDLTTLEREYSPSSCVTDVEAILARYRQGSRVARARLPGWKTCHYGSADVETLDFFPVPAPAGHPRPVLVYIHGGYWQELSKDEHAFPAGSLHRHGMSYVAVNYGLAPEATLDELVQRCRRALAWIVHNSAALGIDPRQIHAAGSSAGAQLAAMLALCEWESYGLAGSPIRSLTLLSGVFDLRPLPLTYINERLRMTPAQALCNSPTLLMDTACAALPPALVVFGENEPGEFKRQSLAFSEAARRRGHAVRLSQIAARNHFDLVLDLGEEGTPFGSLMMEHLAEATRAN